MTDIPSHKLTELEMQMMLMHSLRKLGTLSNTQLIVFMAENDLLNYFDLQQTLYKLTESGHVLRTRLENDDLYELSPAGEKALNMFVGRTMNSYLAIINKQAPEYQRRFLRDRQLSSRMSHEGGAEYHAKLAINEMHMPLLTLDISLPTPELAKRYCDNWQKKAQIIYDTIVHELSEEEAP